MPSDRPLAAARLSVTSTASLRVALASSLRALILAWATFALPVRGHTAVTWVTAVTGVLFGLLALAAWRQVLSGDGRATHWLQRVVSVASALAWLYLTYAFVETGRQLIAGYGSLGVGLSVALGLLALCTSALLLPAIRLGQARTLRVD